MKLYAALREDTQQGWVWLQNPSLPVRSIVKIINSENGKSIYCEALQIDKYFLNIYNQLPRTSIADAKNAIVISGWYRAALGELSSKIDVALIITPSNSWFGKFMACIYHPQVVVRVAAWLGVISVALGFLGVVLGLISICQ